MSIKDLETEKKEAELELVSVDRLRQKRLLPTDSEKILLDDISDRLRRVYADVDSRAEMTESEAREYSDLKREKEEIISGVDYLFKLTDDQKNRISTIDSSISTLSKSVENRSIMSEDEMQIEAEAMRDLSSVYKKLNLRGEEDDVEKFTVQYYSDRKRELTDIISGVERPVVPVSIPVFTGASKDFLDAISKTPTLLLGAILVEVGRELMRR